MQDQLTQDLSTMAKSPTVTTDAVLNYLDEASFEDIAAIKQAASDKMSSMKHLVREQLASDLKAKLDLYNFTPEELGLFPNAPIARGPRKATGGQTRTPKGGPCPICEFETDPPHDGRKHRSQGDDKKPFTDEELAMLHMKRV